MTLYITTFFVPLPLPQTFIRSPNQAPLFVSLPPLPSQQRHIFHTKRLVTSLITSPFFFLNISLSILCSVSSLPFSESFASISFFNFSFCVWGRSISYTHGSNRRTSLVIFRPQAFHEVVVSSFNTHNHRRLLLPHCMCEGTRHRRR